jgi:hypothetical protein
MSGEKIVSRAMSFSFPGQILKLADSDSEQHDIRSMSDRSAPPEAPPKSEIPLLCSPNVPINKVKLTVPPDCFSDEKIAKRGTVWLSPLDDEFDYAYREFVLKLRTMIEYPTPVSSANVPLESAPVMSACVQWQPPPVVDSQLEEYVQARKEMSSDGYSSSK